MIECYFCGEKAIIKCNSCNEPLCQKHNIGLNIAPICKACSERYNEASKEVRIFWGIFLGIFIIGTIIFIGIISMIMYGGL